MCIRDRERHGAGEGSIEDHAERADHHHVGKHELRAHGLLLPHHGIAEPRRVADHLGHHREHKRQRHAQTRADEDARQRRREDDLAQGLRAREAERPSDLEQPRVHARHRAHGVDQHRPQRGENDHHQLHLEREAEQEKPDRCERDPRHRPQDLDRGQGVAPQCRRRAEQKSEHHAGRDCHDPAHEHGPQGMRRILVELAGPGDLDEPAGDGGRSRQVLVLRETCAQRELPERQNQRDRRKPRPVDADALPFRHARCARWPDAVDSAARESAAAAA